MPTYEYLCKKCKKHFERLQPITAARLKKCVHCGGPVDRLIGTGVGLIFKGSGFYTTDYKKAPSGSPEKPPKPPKSEGAKTENKTKKSGDL